MSGTVWINANALPAMDNPAQARANVERVGKTALVMNDSAWSQALRRQWGASSIVTHRTFEGVAGDENRDAHLFAAYDAIAWTRQRAATGANGVRVQCHNEPVLHAGNVGAFVQWCITALTEAHRLGFGLAINIGGVGNPHESLITSGAFDPLLEAMDNRDALMVHEYFLKHPIDPAEYGWLCGRVEHWLERMRRVGSRCKTIIVGEYGRDRAGGQDDGWLGTGWTPEDYTDRLFDGVDLIYQPLADEYGVMMAINVFCAGNGYGRWRSFNIEHAPYVWEMMARWNAIHHEDETEAPPMATGYDSLYYVCPPNGRGYRVFGMGDEHIFCEQAGDGWIRMHKGGAGNPMYFEEFRADARYIYRGMDTSSISPDGVNRTGTFYVLYSPDGAVYGGAPWLPRVVKVGDTFTRTARVKIFTPDGRLQREYTDTTVITVKAHHATYAFQSGISLSNVLELEWGGEERYLYAKGYGLVGWRNIRTNQSTYIGAMGAIVRSLVFPPTPKAPPTTPPPSAPATTPNEPKPGNAGEPIRVKVAPGLVINVRSARSTGGNTPLGQVKQGDELDFYPDTATKTKVNGYHWAWIEKGALKGWIALVEDKWLPNQFVPVGAAPVVIKRLAVPYVGQSLAGALLKKNDCGIACLLMLDRFLEWLAGRAVPSIPTVDDLVRYAPELLTDSPVSLNTILSILTRRGIAANVRRPLSIADIKAEIDAERPVMMLVSYRYIVPGDPFDGGHFVNVIGYTDQGVIIHDPYNGGAGLHLSYAQFELAISQTGTAGLPYQGIVLAA